MSEHPPTPPEHTPPPTPPEDGVEPSLSIQFQDLSPEVRSYVDTLRQQVRDIFQKYGITTTDLREATAQLTSRQDVSTEDLQRLRDLNRVLIKIHETGALPPEQREGIPYERWKITLNPLLLESLHSGKSHELQAAFPGIESSPDPIESLIAHQETFYRTSYNDPSFTIDRSLLTLTTERLEDIQSALERGEIDFPLITATPRNLTPEEQPHTLHRVLFDRLIRQKRIKEWARTDPDVNTFLDQVRDLTLADLTPLDSSLHSHPTGRARTDLLGPDGKPLTFDKDHWLAYLQALYPTLPKPSPQDHLDLSFEKWEQDPPSDRTIPILRTPRSAGQANSTDPSFGALAQEETIGNQSQLDAVRLRYPLPTLSRYLALFSMYHERTRKSLDTTTWSWLLSIIDTTAFPVEPSVIAGWLADELALYRNRPGPATSRSRLRSSR